MPSAPVTAITVWMDDFPDVPPRRYDGARVADQLPDGSLLLMGLNGRVAAIAPGKWTSYRYNRDETATSTAVDGTDEIAATPPGPRLEYVHSDGTRTEIDTADLSELPARERILAKSLVSAAQSNLDKVSARKGVVSNGNTLTFTSMNPIDFR